MIPNIIIVTDIPISVFKEEGGGLESDIERGFLRKYGGRDGEGGSREKGGGNNGEEGKKGGGGLCGIVLMISGSALGLMQMDDE